MSEHQFATAYLVLAAIILLLAFMNPTAKDAKYPE